MQFSKTNSKNKQQQKRKLKDKYFVIWIPLKNWLFSIWYLVFNMSSAWAVGVTYDVTPTCPTEDMWYSLCTRPQNDIKLFHSQ